FANLECQQGDSYGFCVTSLECSNFGGTSLGSCARGFGTCCFKSLTTCDTTSNMNVTYIRNPDWSSATTSSGTCNYYIERAANVCQLRLDFEKFEMYIPSADGDTDDGKCDNDKLTITPKSADTFDYFCGKMPPKFHYYVDVRDISTDTHTNFQFTMGSAVTQSRYWSIRVTQVSCDMR
ncbi:unnamed protein product, partial [Meganyctiphanes norvegica]